MSNISQSQTVTLFDLLDRTINKGVVVEGQVMLTVADIDLVTLQLRLLLSGIETLNHPAAAGGSGQALKSGSPKGNGERKGIYQPARLTAEVVGPSLNQQLQGILGNKRMKIDPEKVERGLAKLVLTLVELLRRLMESQAVRRMEGDSLTTGEVERMGLAFKKLSQRMEDLKKVFELSDEDLNLELGPLGRMM